MSLVLNGGVGGSGTTQYSYLASKIASALPIVTAAWFKTGTDSNSGGHVSRVCQSTASAGNYSMGLGLSRSTGPVFSTTAVVRNTAGTSATHQTREDLTEGRYAYPVTAIASGSTTTVSVDTLGDAMPYVAGMYVRLGGTLTGLSGIVTSREYRVASVSGANIVLEVSTTGTLSEGWSATVKWSTWQPERWNLLVCRLNSTADPARVQTWGGFFGASGITVVGAISGSVNPSEVWDVADRICFGGSYQSDTGTGTFRGELAHLAVWGGADVDDSKAAELLTVAPNLVSWGTPLAYVPCIDDGTASIGATNLTTVGSPTFTSDGPSITLSGGGGGSGYLPNVMRSRNPSIFGVR